MDAGERERLGKIIEASDARCPACRDPLRGLAIDRCPECGFGFDAGWIMVLRASRVLFGLGGLRDAIGNLSGALQILTWLRAYATLNIAYLARGARDECQCCT